MRRRSVDPVADPVADPESHVRFIESVEQTSGWSESTPPRYFTRLVAKAVKPRPRGTVAVAGGADVALWARLLRERWPALCVVEVPVDLDPAEAHLRLCEEGYLDAVVDASDVTVEQQLDLFDRLFGHLGVDRPYLVRQAHPGVHGDVWSRCAGAQGLRLHRLAGTDPSTVTDDRALRSLGQCIGRLEARAKAVVVTPRVPSLAKIREEQVGSLLGRAPGRGEVLHRLPAAELVSRCEYRDNGKMPDPHRLESFSAPPLELRRYDDPVCLPQQIVTTGRLLLPDSFRLVQQQRLVSSALRETSPLFARPLFPLSDARRLPGSWYHLDSEVPGHFGHFMTEQISLLWGLEEARRHDPELRVLITRPPSRTHAGLAEFERAVLATYGVAEDQVTLFDGPVQVDRLFSATPMFSCPDRGHDEIGLPYVHPGIRDTWRRIGDALAAQAPSRERPRRIFCTRPPGHKRSCRNADEVERLFEAHGFVVVRPEEHPPAEQVALFRSADVVAGFAGSGMFTLALCDTPKDVIVLGPTSYTGRNEYPISAVLGHRLTTVWSDPDVVHPPGGWTFEAFYSGFTFDFADEGVFLREALAQLGPVQPARPVE